ncbi:MAG: hypothetical protein WCL04_02015, partial [Verrucomicrobiota bacterium]
MKTKLYSCLLAALVFAGCASPASRIASHQAAFDSWPAEVRNRVRAGEIAVGFTPEQVRVALGRPDRVLMRTSVTGEAEVWVYRELEPASSSLGVGIGVAGSAGVIGGGMSLDGYSYEEIIRVVFAH